MRVAIVIRHAPARYEHPNITCHVTSRVQHIPFPLWQLRSIVRCYRAARAFYGPDRVSIERW